MNEAVKFEIDLKEFTASSPKRGIPLIFLIGQFEDGCFLGFWSHSPWGRVHDMEQGWAVISKDGEWLDDCETRSMGCSIENSWRDWRKSQKQTHGKLKPFRHMDGELVWKIGDC